VGLVRHGAAPWHIRDPWKSAASTSRSSAHVTWPSFTIDFADHSHLHRKSSSQLYTSSSSKLSMKLWKSAIFQGLALVNSFGELGFGMVQIYYSACIKSQHFESALVGICGVFVLH